MKKLSVFVLGLALVGSTFAAGTPVFKPLPLPIVVTRPSPKPILPPHISPIKPTPRPSCEVLCW